MRKHWRIVPVAAALLAVIVCPALATEREYEEHEQRAELFLGDADNDGEHGFTVGLIYEYRFTELLGLDSESHEFRLVYGHFSQSSGELAILSRSMIEVLMEIGTYVEVPPDHLAEGRVRPVLTETEDLPSGLSHVMRIASSEREPTDAFVSVKYRNRWFWIDDRDPLSRGMLSFLMVLFSLAETGGPTAVPVVTIPAG